MRALAVALPAAPAAHDEAGLDDGKDEENAGTFCFGKGGGSPAEDPCGDAICDGASRSPAPALHSSCVPLYKQRRHGRLMSHLALAFLHCLHANTIRALLAGAPLPAVTLRTELGSHPPPAFPNPSI